uniref:Uncharacterized protein n=1 Tax=Kumanoa americana TaxID=1196377 RepID=A0A1C9CGP3_9FLOR|nr:hypothetical protein Kuma_117 [Kumanoa americana]AOM67551.1 hypothetical protein Kuma_117 [Kumanoa americana]
MIKYWPNQQGKNLNLEVVALFRRVYLKFNANLYNKTSQILSTDIVTFSVKKELFKIILFEFEILILDIIELDLTREDLENLKKKLLMDLINKSIDSFKLFIDYNELDYFDSWELCDQYLLIENLLVHLVFGSFSEEFTNSIFLEQHIPVKYVEILLDNIIIQIAHIIFFRYIVNQFSLSSLLTFLVSCKLCNETYISLRSLASFKNNLVWQHWLNYYCIQPKVVYSNLYKIWIFTPQGLDCKYIYLFQKDGLNELSNLQIIVTLLLEVQDFFWPKLRNIYLLLSKILIYSCSYFFYRLYQIFMKSIFLVFRSNKVK